MHELQRVLERQVRKLASRVLGQPQGSERTRVLCPRAGTSKQLFRPPWRGHPSGPPLEGRPRARYRDSAEGRVFSTVRLPRSRVPKSYELGERRPPVRTVENRKAGCLPPLARLPDRRNGQTCRWPGRSACPLSFPLGDAIGWPARPTASRDPSRRRSRSSVGHRYRRA
jgi:hypothetical protein